MANMGDPRYADPFDDWCQRELRSLKAKAVVDRVLRCTEYEKTEAQQINEGFDGTDPSERLEKRVSEALGTPYWVWIERNLCRRTYDMTVRCKSCHVYWSGDVTELALEHAPRTFDDFADRAVAAILAGRNADEVDEGRACFCVDGLRPRHCLDMFIGAQNLADRGRAHDERVRLTDAQRAMARRMWSQQLRAKQHEAREKERNQVRVDIQEVE